MRNAVDELATSPLELKQLVSETCLYELGEVAPADWHAGLLDSMVVQLLDPQGLPIAMEASTPFEWVLASSTLRVTYLDPAEL